MKIEPLKKYELEKSKLEKQKSKIELRVAMSLFSSFDVRAAKSTVEFFQVCNQTSSVKVSQFVKFF